MAKKPAIKESGERKRLVLLDTHAIIHRGYHAIPELTSSDGQPTGALYGLVSMLLRIVNELEPDYIVAARDLPGPTHRHEKFEAYKGTRVKAEDALVAQLERAPIVFEAFGIPLYAAPGYEADDCIGTIVTHLSSHSHIDTIIASGDMDTLQLVSPTVVVYTMRKGITDIVLYDDAAVRKRYGFGPEHMTDYKALRGDPSDNIPGIRGVGEKTATELIRAFGTIENIYKALDEGGNAFAQKGFTSRITQLLTDGREAAFFSKDLATIRTNAPIKFNLPDTPWSLVEHVGSIERLCDMLEFKSLKSRVRALVDKSVGGEEAIPTRELPQVDPQVFAETAVATWVLNSDLTNPTVADILDFAGTDDFDVARETVFVRLADVPSLQKVYDEIEKPLIPIVARMRMDGVTIDVKYLAELAREYKKELEAIERRIYRHAGHEFNINSPKQIGVVLYDELGIGEGAGSRKKTATGARTTREDELVKLSQDHPIVADILAYRELAKLLSTYVEKIPTLVAEDGRLHAEFLQAGAATGRMASQNPNVQNIPTKTEYGRRIREGFVAAPGYVLAAIDYSQIELRIAAGLSHDEKLIRVFQEGGDIHAEVASLVFGVEKTEVTKEMRRRAKVINFGILYGMGVNALRAALGGDVTRAQASEYLNDYFKTFAGVAAYIEETKAFAHKHGYVETLYGRRRHFPGLRSSLPGVVAAAERMAVNAPMQGTQADIIKLAMIEADRMLEREGLRDRARLLLQVHDELIYEVREEDAQTLVPRLRQVMESVVLGDMLAGVPIIAEASVGKNWGELERIGR